MHFTLNVLNGISQPTQTTNALVLNLCFTDMQNYYKYPLICYKYPNALNLLYNVQHFIFSKQVNSN